MDGMFLDLLVSELLFGVDIDECFWLFGLWANGLMFGSEEIIPC